MDPQARRAKFHRRWWALGGLATIITLCGVVYTIGVERQTKQARALEAAAQECVYTRNEVHRLWTRYLTAVSTHTHSQDLQSAPTMLPAGSPIEAQEARMNEIEAHHRNAQEHLDRLKSWQPPAAPSLGVTDVERLLAILDEAPPEVTAPDIQAIQQLKRTLASCPKPTR